MFSVIIPAYNSEKYIEKCLKSVLSQKNADFEIIVINDGSTDKTGEICRTFLSDQRLMYIEQKNCGQGSARNAGIDIARGDWLLFLDSDDEMCEGCLEHINNHINDHQDVELIRFGYEIIFSNGNREVRNPQKSACSSRGFVEFGTTLLWDKAFSAKLWRRAGIRLSNYFGEDVIASYLCGAKAQKADCIDVAYVRHFVRGDNMSCDVRRVEEIVYSLRETLNAFRECDLLWKYSYGLIKLLAVQIMCCSDSRVFEMSKECIEKISDEIRRMHKSYFGETELVFIGKDDFGWLWETLGLRRLVDSERIHAYESIDQYLSIQSEESDRPEIFILDTENELSENRLGVRDEKWLSDRFARKIRELVSQSFKRGRPIKWIILDENGLLCNPGGISTQCDVSYFVEKDEFSVNLIRGTSSAFSEEYIDNSFWNRGEQYRYKMNEAVLAGWLDLKMHGVSLREFFHLNGYDTVGIYGMGYMGRLLYDELLGDHPVITCIMEKKSGSRAGHEIVGLGDDIIIPKIMVITLPNLYYRIRHELELSYEGIKVISITDVIENLICERIRR